MLIIKVWSSRNDVINAETAIVTVYLNTGLRKIPHKELLRVLKSSTKYNLSIIKHSHDIPKDFKGIMESCVYDDAYEVLSGIKLHADYRKVTYNDVAHEIYLEMPKYMSIEGVTTKSEYDKTFFHVVYKSLDYFKLDAEEFLSDLNNQLPVLYVGKCGPTAPFKDSFFISQPVDIKYTGIVNNKRLYTITYYTKKFHQTTINIEL